jgi:hypothetical protein
MLAEEIAVEAEIVPWERMDEGVWASLFSAADQREDRPAEARKIALDYAKSHASWVLEPDGDPTVVGPSGGWIGTKTMDGKLALFPHIVKEVLDRNGYALDAVKHAWDKRGWIYRQGRDLTRKVPFGKAYPRMLVFEPVEEEASVDDS